jgi:hypothetical protein
VRGMNKTWLLTILIISLALLAILKTHELRSLSPYFRAEKVIKLKSFEKARPRINKQDIDLLELWESILTGRSAPLSRFMKERYQKLGLNHLFTPSGFHLSAVLFPFLKFLKNSRQKLVILLLIGIGLFFLPGLGALKRMLIIKTNQNLLGLHLGFILAMVLDIFFGTFQNSTLSFSYSFLFLGIIYSGLKGLSLIIWFFIGQVTIAYFQGNDISLLLLLFSPVLNFGFALLMPMLFLLSFPLWDWQLSSGIFVLRQIQWLVDFLASLIQHVPMLEINMATLLLIGLLLFRRWKTLLILLLLFSHSLNLDRAKYPGAATNEFVPQGKVLKIVGDRIYFSDGSCRLKLVRGMWFENCSPKRRSNRNKKLKKLSYPS